VPRQYSLTVWVEVDGRKLDLVEPATAFTVTPADYFGTGRLPYAAQGPFLVRSRWTAEHAPHPEAECSQVRNCPQP
jgi:hypothetical protein